HEPIDLGPRRHCDRAQLGHGLAAVRYHYGLASPHLAEIAFEPALELRDRHRFAHASAPAITWPALARRGRASGCKDMAPRGAGPPRSARGSPARCPPSWLVWW